MIEYRQISPDSPLYPGACELRELVLLRPIGYDMARFKAGYPGVEERGVHFVAAMETPGGPRVVGSALLISETDEPGRGKLMQMAVHPQRQGEGIGKRLVIEAETHAFTELGLEGLFCHAQLDAIPFYEKLGWRTDSETFQEAGIPHKKMRLDRPTAVGSPPLPVSEW
ncbi:MAG: GNAT family N-acetyltransferase [Planctomycetota bacterium]